MSRSRTIRLAPALALLLVATLAGGQDPRPAPDAKTGIKVGEKAPGFALKDADGKDRTLDEFLGGRRRVALVFTRSADW